MLQVTDTAVSMLQEARVAQEIPETFGVRVFAKAGDNGEAALALAFTEEPVEGDQVTKQSGTEIYISPDVAEPLAQSKLDVEQTPEGPLLALRPQEQEQEQQ